jgi:16S rRNA processing protein RimM
VLEVGRITRPHGLRGDVVVQLITTELARLEPGSVLHTADGELVVESARAHQKNWVVKFRDIDGREAADELRGELLLAEPVDGDGGDESLWVHELIGAEVVDADGISRGHVEAVQDNPASDILVLDSGALVPLTFVIGWDERGSRLRVDPPPGLFEL